MEQSCDLTGAQWLGGPGNTLNRKTFTLPRRPRSATLRITADTHHYAREYWMKTADNPDPGNWLLGGSFLKFRIFVNGALVGAGPFRAIRNGNCVVHNFDLLPFLREGENVLGIFARGEEKGFALRLELDWQDGTREAVLSDNTWKSRNADRIYRTVCWERQAMSQMFKGGPGPGEWDEHIDGQLWPDGWAAPGFDDRAWPFALPRGPVAETLELAGLANYQPERVAPRVVRKLTDGAYWIDFGREVFAGIELTGPEKGGTVELRLSENLLDDGRVQFIMQTFNCFQEAWKFRAGGQKLAHFGLRMFRYAEVVGYDGELTPDKIAAVTMNTPFGTGEADFSCDSKELEAVWRLCRDTIAFTNADTYTDSLSRERIAYEADSYINLLTSLAVERNFDLARRTVFYQMEHPTWPCEWRQFMIPLVYEYGMASGDLNPARTLYGKLASEWSFHPLRDATGLVREFPKKVIVDWPETQRDGYEFGPYNNVPNAFVYYDLVLLAELAHQLGRDADARQWKALAAEQAAAFNRVLFDPESRTYCDCAESKHHSAHATIFAAAFGLIPEHRKALAGEFLVKRGMVCSVYGAQFLLEALFRLGRGADAVELILSGGEHGWLQMLKNGGTAAFEAWNAREKPNMTKSHPWGSAPGNQIVRGIFGLRPTRPGWAEYEFNPAPGRIREAAIVVPTARGFFHAKIRQTRGGVEKSLEIKPAPDPAWCGASRR